MKTNPSSRQLRELPPRTIGLYTKAITLFGGFMQQFGWIFFVMGSLFAWVFIPLSEVRYWFETGKDWQQTTGRVVSAEPTNSSVNDERVYQYLHAFELDGERFTGKSYSVGLDYQEGQQVGISFDANDPSNSYMAGGRRAVFPAFVLFVLIFPLVGLVFILLSIRQNGKAIRLLEIGEFTRGAMRSKEATGSSVKINHRTYPVYRYTFEFQAGGRICTATCKTHQTWLVEDEVREIILYDKYNPDFNTVYDAIGNMPGISENGMLEAPGPGKAIYLLLPVIGIGINIFGAMGMRLLSL